MKDITIEGIVKNLVVVELMLGERGSRKFSEITIKTPAGLIEVQYFNPLLSSRYLKKEIKFTSRPSESGGLVQTIGTGGYAESIMIPKKDISEIEESYPLR